MRNLQFGTNFTTREGSSVDLYFSDIARFRVLTAEEEVALAQRIRSGDKEALDHLVSANLRFVISVAKKYQHQGLALVDLINEGNLGLIRAAGRFDETKGFKFISYAVWWIRQSIMAAISEHARMIRIPQNRIHEIGTVHKAFNCLEQELMYEPTYEQVSARVNCHTERVSEVLSYSGFTQSYDTPFGEDGFAMIDQLVSDELPADWAMLAESERAEFNALLDSLTDRERRVIEMSFGIGEEWEMSPPDISPRLGLSAERVRQIRDNALWKLKMRALSGEFDLA